jgi:hypothetical protein
MAEPQRIQLSRRKGSRMPAGAIKVDRTTDWGNPFRVGETIGQDDEDLWPYVARLPGVAGDPRRGPLYAPLTSVRITGAQLAVDLFSCWFIEQPHLMIRAFEELPGKSLACWCKIGSPCHADWLLGAVNEGLFVAEDDDG